jgi:DNA-binding response OmpR family regulator
MAQRGRRILIVEDDPVLSSYLCALLDQFGYFTDAASTGLDALWIAGRQRPDVAIMDISITATMGANDLVQVLRAGFELPVILLSNPSESDPLTLDGVAQSSVLSLPKPPSPSELLQVLEQAISGKLPVHLATPEDDHILDPFCL